MKGPIAAMARKSVAANLLMFFLLFGGAFFMQTMQQEVFPELDLDTIRIGVSYPGASPEDVEQGILLAIEEQIEGISAIKSVRSQAFSGQGSVMAELFLNSDGSSVLQDVQNAIGRIQSFPKDAERPQVELIEAKQQVLSLVLWGDVDESTLLKKALSLKEVLKSDPDISYVKVSARRDREIHLEMPLYSLWRSQTDINSFAQTLKAASVDIPLGSLKGEGGDILLRIDEQIENKEGFEKVPLLKDLSGERILLSDLATVKDGFAESELFAYFNGKRAMRVDVFRVGKQKPLQVAAAAKVIAAAFQDPSLTVTVWNDMSELYEGRMNLLVRNAYMGLFLVLILLGIFLEPKLAFWVTLGIPISIFGAFLFIPLTGATINMISLFAFIITLGIVVDDAIVVGEIIYQKREEGMAPLEAAISGAKEIAMPVVFAVLTNIVAFMPLFFVPGISGKLFKQIPAVVVFVFFISLVESLFILPAHLGNSQEKDSKLARVSQRFNRALKTWVDSTFQPFMKKVLEKRYITLSLSVALLIFAFGLVGGGRLKFSFLPNIDGDMVTGQILLPVGVPLDYSQRIQAQMSKAAMDLIEDEGGDISKGIYTQIGAPLLDAGPTSGTRSGGNGAHIIAMQIVLKDPSEREIGGEAFAKAWRERVGDIPGAQSTQFSANINHGSGAPIDIELSHKNVETLQLAASDLAEKLDRFSVVTDIDKGVEKGRSQLAFSLNPYGQALGLSEQSLGMTLRNAYWGALLQRYQDQGEEVKVYLRLPREERESLYSLEKLFINSSQGPVFIRDVSDIHWSESEHVINRRKGRRVLSVTADLKDKSEALEVSSKLNKIDLKDLANRYPGLSYSFEGEQKEQRDSMQSLLRGFILTLFILYSLLAIPFNSYTQPLIVMMSIPFGFLGAFLGHALLGYSLSIISMFGLIALSGVVINDALVLVVSINRFIKEGMSPFDAACLASKTRFRPIILTSLTTFLGLAPMIFETSLQARFLIPMAISLGFGILFATVIILLIIPSLYLILEDLKSKMSSL